jgi:hypothetical protein
LFSGLSVLPNMKWYHRHFHRKGRWLSFFFPPVSWCVARSEIVMSLLGHLSI